MRSSNRALKWYYYFLAAITVSIPVKGVSDPDQESICVDFIFDA